MFEVNLVPDVKAELLKRQKMRNFVIYISILCALICVAALVLLGLVVAGQNIALASQDGEMEEKSKQILESDNINLNLTIQDQLGNLAAIGENRQVLSRVFGILDVMLPTGEEEVTISELSINLPNSTLTFDGQAKSTSNNNYRALEVFKNTVSRSYFDYGRYIDSEGNEIPTYCIDEVVEAGVIKGIYHKGAPGCGQSPLIQSPDDDSDDPDTDTEDTEDADEDDAEETPAEPVEDIPIKRNMTTKELEEAIAGKEYYFQSACIVDGVNSCLLTDESADQAVLIRESSNGRNSAGDLVLRFSTTVILNPNVFSFSNKHIRVIGPTRQNVTDSYTQIRDMFTEEAKDCAPNDYDCINAGGGN